MNRTFYLTFAILLLCCGNLHATSLTYKYYECTFSLDSETKEATLVTVDNSGYISIPRRLYMSDDVEYTVTALGDSCLSYCTKLTSIIIPAYVTKLGKGCFSGCSNLKSVDFENGSSLISLGDGCFEGCLRLSEIEIPSSLSYMGEMCFSGCTALTEITIPSSATYLGYQCFGECNNLTKIICYATTPPHINKDNFDSGIIATSCTLYVPVGSVELYKSARGWKEFSNISTSDIEVIDNFKYRLNPKTREATLVANGYSGDIIVPAKVTASDDFEYRVTALGDSCFLWCDLLNNITIPSSVTKLGVRCFYGCYGLTEIVIPESVTSMGMYCFAYCYSLQNITISSSLTLLRRGCFSHCTSLREITIPSSVTSLGDYCFERCISLVDVTIPSSLTSLGAACFSNCNVLSEITIPKSITSLRDACFSGTAFTEFTIPDHVTSLGDGCFEGCSWLTEVTIPASVTSVGDKCFDESQSLKIICYATVPPKANEVIWSIAENPLYVPASSVSAYKSAKGWKHYKNIYAIEDNPTDISAAKTRDVVVTAQGGIITISGLEERESVYLYTIDSKPIGTATAVNGTASLATSASGVVIAKIGGESIKIQVE